MCRTLFLATSFTTRNAAADASESAPIETVEILVAFTYQKIVSNFFGAKHQVQLVTMPNEGLIPSLQRKFWDGVGSAGVSRALPGPVGSQL